MFFYIARFVCSVIFHVKYRISVTGLENIPDDGGFILCSNHASGYDPVLICISMKRPLHFMAKKELFKNRFWNSFFHGLNCFPVDRKSVEMSTFKTALKLLKEGKALLLFSQGTRVRELDTKAAKSGVALFAVKAGVPIVPAYVGSDFKLFSKVSITFGRPIELDEYKGRRLDTATLNEITENIMERVKELE